MEVRLREGPAPRLLEALREGEIDLALVVGGPEEFTDNGIDSETCLVSEIRLLLPRSRPAQAGRAVNLASLADERLVTLQPGSGFRRRLEAAGFFP